VTSPERAPALLAALYELRAGLQGYLAGHGDCEHQHLAELVRLADRAIVRGRRGSKNAGSRNGRAKLNERQAGEIRWLLEHTSLRQRAIAARYGVSSGTVSDIARGHRWAGVLPQAPPHPEQEVVWVPAA
jgi:hypothetical protein